MQRIENFRVIELMRLDVRLAQRRHPEIHEGVAQPGAAESARRSGERFRREKGSHSYIHVRGKDSLTVGV
jgi:hypothetical protein